MQIKKFPHDLKPSQFPTSDTAEVYYPIYCNICKKQIKQGEKFKGTFWKENGAINRVFAHKKCNA